MADLNATKFPEPAVNMKPTLYRIHPRNWQAARNENLHHYAEARYHRTIDSIEDLSSHQTYEPHKYFLDSVTLPKNCSPGLREIGSMVESALWHVPTLRVSIKECNIQGPDGSISIVIQPIDKLKSSVDMETPKAKSSRSKSVPRTLVSSKALAREGTPKIVESLSKMPQVVLAAKITNMAQDGYEGLVVRAPGSKYRDPAGEWESIDRTLLKLASSYEERLKKLARMFTGKPATTVDEADHAIDIEVERRIVADLLARTNPIDERFWMLPYNLVVDIFKKAMNVPNRVQPYAYRGASGGNGFYLPEYLAPTPTSLRLVDGPSWANSANSEPKTLRDVSAVALYSHTIYAFSSPKRVHQWLEALTEECLHLVRTIEVQFETDVALKYSEDFLGFMYNRMTSHMESALDGRRLEQLFKKLDHGCRNPTLIFRFPNKSRMGFSDEHGTCHLTLCKWLAKAIGTCAALYPKVKVVLKGHVYNDGTKQLDDDTLAMLRTIFDAPNEMTWLALGVQHHEDLVASLPPCHCAG